jgi:uncharacterized protein YdaU (DUF1376 family)
VAEKVDIFMPLFVADYLADTTDLTTEEHGAYLLLLMASWRNGGTITSDHAKLARIAKLSPSRWKSAWESLSRFFVVGGDSMHQKRLREEHEKAMGRKLAASESGRLGAAAKHGIHVLSGTTRSQRMTAARAIATHSELQWEILVSEFNGRCVRCGSSGHKPERDHIVPIYQGGHDGIDNIQPVCPRCNSSKGSETKNWAEYRRKNGWGTPSEMPGVATTKCVSDSGSSPSPSPSPEDLSPPAPAIPGGTWSAWDWFNRFSRQWSGKYQRLTYGQGEGDSKAIGQLGEVLEALPFDERVAAQLLATEMIAEYLADESPGRVKARHPWKWFVEGFNGFRAPRARVEAKANGPPRRDQRTSTRDVFAEILAPKAEP